MGVIMWHDGKCGAQNGAEREMEKTLWLMQGLWWVNSDFYEFSQKLWIYLWKAPKALSLYLNGTPLKASVEHGKSTVKSVPEDPEIKLFPKVASLLPKEGFLGSFYGWIVILTLSADRWGKQPAVGFFAENRGSHVGCFNFLFNSYSICI